MSANFEGSSAASSSDSMPAAFSLLMICSSNVIADGTSTLMSSMSVNIRLMPWTEMPFSHNAPTTVKMAARTRRQMRKFYKWF